MNKKLEDALNSVEMTYGELVEIANGIVDPIVKSANELVGKLDQDVNALSNDQLREYTLMLQLKAFGLSETKEKAGMKADLALALQKEAYAVSYASMEGAQGTRDRLATTATAQETLVQVMYSLVSNLLKTKVDQLHRLVDALKSILISRGQEAKFMNVGSTNQGAGALNSNGRTILNESTEVF